MITFALISIFLIVISIGMPIGVSMVFASIAVIVALTELPLAIVPQVLLSGLNKFELLAVPLFILAAEIMNAGGLTRRVFRLALLLAGWIKGGLAQVNIMASVIFAGISGAAIADIAGLGRVEYKAMEEAGYSKKFSAAISLASMPIGGLVPPSFALIVYAVEAQVSVGRMLLAGVVPGLALAAVLMAFVYFLSATGRVHTPPVERPSRKNALLIVREGLPALIAPLIIMGGLVGGWFTVTETGVIACLYSLAVAFGVHRELPLKKLLQVLETSILSSSLVMFMIAGASLMSWLITYDQSIFALSGWFADMPVGNIAKLLLINLFLILIGLVIEGLPAMLIVLPVLLPIIIEMGMDPVQFGIVMSFSFLIGLLTPPVGLGLFVMSNITGLSVATIARAMLIFFIPLVGFLLLLTFVPAVSTWLPYLLLP